jgi:hypothetical protein
MKKVVSVLLFASMALLLAGGAVHAAWYLNAPGTTQQVVPGVGGGSFYLYVSGERPVAVSVAATGKCNWSVVDLSGRPIASAINQSSFSWQLPATATSGYRIICTPLNGTCVVTLTARW